jgi:endonuclease G, mitochondrial
MRLRLFITLVLLAASNFIYSKSLEYLPIPSTDLVRHAYYTLSYNEKYEEANWVYYSLTDSMVLNGGEERSNQFKIDPLVPTGSAKSSDYTKSGYDRGHLCPAGDMGFNPKAMYESFMMSNISPQKPDFNRGIWKELETSVRGWAKKEHKIIIVTGPVFKDDMGTIGKDEVEVPGYFFKVILDITGEPKMIAFLIPNEKSDRPIRDFAVPADEVEKLTGFDLFSQLPDSEETKLESKVELAGWFDGYKPSEPVAKQSKPLAKQTESDMKLYVILISVLLIVVIFVAMRSKNRSR